MARRVLESLTGIGEVYVGDVMVRRTHYQLALFTDDPVDGDDSSDSVQVDGSIDIHGIAEAVVLASPDQLTLRLADGRRLPFRLTGSGGTIVGRGGLQL
jgi:hypothetical protein